MLKNFNSWKSGSKLPHSKNLALLTDGLLLRRDCSAPRTLPRARVRVGALSAHRQIAPMANATIGLDFNQPADVHLDLLTEIAFDASFLLDGLTDMIDFIFRQVANLLRVIDACFGGESARALLPDTIDRGQPNPEALLRRKIYTCDA